MWVQGAKHSTMHIRAADPRARMHRALEATEARHWRQVEDDVEEEGPPLLKLSAMIATLESRIVTPVTLEMGERTRESFSTFKTQGVAAQSGRGCLPITCSCSKRRVGARAVRFRHLLRSAEVPIPSLSPPISPVPPASVDTTISFSTPCASGTRMEKRRAAISI